jgi:hypothetical protein
MAQQISLDHLKIASPCLADWEAMPGNDQVRFCDRCQLNVYDISAMTSTQATELIAQTEGRLCARIYRRLDGTVMTSDCPVGLRALRRKASFVTATALGAIFSLFNDQTTVWADDGHRYFKHYTVKVIRQQVNPLAIVISGRVADQIGVAIPNANVVLISEKTKEKYTTTSDNEGKYRIPVLEEGGYEIAISSVGFIRFRKQGLKLNKGEVLQLNIVLEVGTVGEVVDIANPPPIETIDKLFPLKLQKLIGPR